MKARITNNVNTDIKFPCLMVAEFSTGKTRIVLMIRKDNELGTGMELYRDDANLTDYKIIHDWAMECFKPYTGDLVLSNH